MISGAHTIIYSNDAARDRAFFRDVLELPNIDLGGGWLVFALPPSELAFHPSETSSAHEIYFISDDINEFVSQVSEHGVNCSDIEDTGWGLVTRVTLPGGGTIGVYEAKHARPSSG